MSSTKRAVFTAVLAAITAVAAFGPGLQAQAYSNNPYRSRTPCLWIMRATCG